MNVKVLLQALWQAWENFWWQDPDPRSVFWTRVCFGTSAFFVSALRFWTMDLYNQNAVVSKDQALHLLSPVIEPAWSWTFWPDSFALSMQILLMILLALFTLGYTRRPFIFLAWVIHVGFMQRNFAASMGVDSMILVFLLYLSFVEVWKKANYDGLSRVMVKMLQVHLAIIYFYTGVEKLRGGTWWEGSSLWLVFNNTQITLWDLSFLAHFPVAIAMMAHLTILFEIFFPAFVFNPKTKFWIMGLGLFFHVGIALFLDLWGFSALMVSQYFLYIRKDEWDRLVLRLGLFKKSLLALK